MWKFLKTSSQDPVSLEFQQDLSRSITINSMVFLTGGFLIWAYLLGSIRPGEYLGNVMLIAIPSLLTAALTWYLSNTRLFLAQVIYLTGILLSIILAIYLLQEPMVALMLALLPLLAAITIGWPAALIANLLVIALMLIFARYPWIFPLSAADRLAVALGGILAGLLSALAVTSLLSVAKHSYLEFTTARKQMEESRQQRLELIQAQQELQQANHELARLSERLKVLTQVAEESRRIKEEFVANVSHELRTPLNMIIGFSELISKAPRLYGDLPAALLADIAAIQRNSQHLADLVNDVLDLSQVEAGKMALSKDWTTLQELVETAVSSIKVLYDTKGLYLKTEIPEESIRIFCDRTRIREVLLNLLSNAGRFTDQGGVTIRATINNTELEVKVTDTGPGISPENQSRLFEPFQQLDNSIRRQDGSGLGLSISKQFVEMHGGKMWLESNIGVGTTFSFSLPVSQTKLFAPLRSGANRWITPYHQYDKEFRRSKVPAPIVMPRYVLLDKGNSLTRLFSRYQASVETISVTNLEEAIEAIAISPCQGLIVNGATTGLTADIIHQTGRLPFITPVMICWLSGDIELKKKFGVENYLLKPISREKLLDAILKVNTDVHTILLVDDEVEVLQLFARILQSTEKEYIVLRARSGKQALEILRERRPDVMLIDMVMPEMDGFQVIKEKNADESIREIPVIIVSSKDPSGAPIISESMVIARKGGLSTRELLVCMQTVSEILAPESPSVGRARQESLPG